MAPSTAPPPRVVDGARIRDDLIDRVRVASEAAPRFPCLGIVYDGSNAASRRWTGYKRDACARAAVRLVARDLDGGAGTEAAVPVVRQLDADPDVDAIFLQTPLPAGVDPVALASLVSPAKDVDGLHRGSSGSAQVPATAQAALCVLESHGVRLLDAEVVILGEADPILDALAVALAEPSRGAFVSTVSPTDPAARRVCSQAGILVTAAGQPGLVDDEWLSRGSVVIDAGVLVGGGTEGDVTPEAIRSKVALLCPARGGLGPVTVAILVRRTVELAGVPLRPQTREQ
jgi:methylenetetrahydrofolate dehydrogenase (NADP+)/methenyltetrahydrofolate cyclohydrolase